MEFEKHEDALLKSQKDQISQRDWFLLVWLTVLIPVDLILSQSQHSGGRSFLFLGMMFQFLTTALLLASKSVYAHYLGLLIHTEPGVKVQKWINLHIGLSISIFFGFVLNHLSILIYIWTIRSE